MSGSMTDTSRCEPNLVPILDMVFQLITFFMLVVNFKATEVDRELTLPVRYLIEIVAAEFSGLARRVGRESFSRSDLCTD